MYNIMKREPPANRLDHERWALIENPDETPWAGETFEEVQQKLLDELCRTPKNDLMVVQVIPYEVLVQEPTPEPDTPPDEPVTPPDNPDQGGNETGGGTGTGGETA